MWAAFAAVFAVFAGLALSDHVNDKRDSAQIFDGEVVRVHGSI